MSGDGESCGVLYIASGDEYIAEAIRSARSVNEHTDLETAIATDAWVETDAFDHVIAYDCETVTINDRTWLLNSVIPAGLSPFDRTLYLDSDTLVRADITPMFDVLDEYELAVARVPERPTVDGCPDYWRLFNCGVILFRETPAVTSLFDDWRDKYIRDRRETDDPVDQPAFSRALYESDVQWYCLPREYNVRVPRRGLISGDVKIVHGRHRAGLDRVARELEQSELPRVFRERSLWFAPTHSVTARGSLRYHIEATIHNHGLLTVLRVGKSYVMDRLFGTNRMAEYGDFELG